MRSHVRIDLVSRAAGTAVIALAALLAGLTFLAAPALAAPRVALVSLADEAGIDPRALTDITTAIRGVALEEAIDVLLLDLGQADLADRCDDTCVDRLARPLEADLVMTGTVRVVEEGLTLELGLREIGRQEVLRMASRFAPDTEGLVASAEALARNVFAAIRKADRPPLAATPRPPRPVSVAEPAAASKSPGVALALELLLPGLGLGYAEAWGDFALQYAGILTGIILVVSSVDGGGDLDSGFLMGLTLVLGARLFGIVRAPTAATEWNRHHAGPRDRGRYSAHRELVAPSHGVTPPGFTRLHLPTLTF